MVPSEPAARVLVVDDEPVTARAIQHMATHFGYDVTVAASVESAVERFDERPFDVVLTDINLGTENGFDLLRHILGRDPDVPVIMITGFATMDSAMEAIQAGAFDYLAKPPSLETLGALLKRAVDEKRQAASAVAPALEPNPQGFDNIAGRSPQMLEVYKTVARVAPGRTSVLILGESGTGKELVAHALHRRSTRADRRFVPVNVSAIPDGLLESELFGHVRGSFTGATANRRGLFEEAHQGTLFLDEIGDLSLPLQAKLLRVVQEHRLKPVGGNDEIEVDVRLVVATHQNLEKMVASGRFREDLYYRLNVISIVLPPLRERGGDIPLLIEHFLHKYGRESGHPPAHLAPDALRAMTEYTWPGNVRELANVIERAVLLSRQGLVTVDALPERLQGGDRPAFPTTEAERGWLTLDAMVDRYVEQVLVFTHGNRSHAAKVLGISRRTLHRMNERKRRMSPDGDGSPDPGTDGADT